MTKKIYLNLIRKLQQNKYKNFIFSNKQEKIYLKFRKIFYKKIKSFLEKKSTNIQNLSKSKLNDNLKIIKKKTKLSKKNQFILYNLRKKFEVNLNLKKNYDKNLIKATNQNADINTLVLFVECICKFKLLNKISTFNLLLKFVDIINIEFYRNKLLINTPKSINKIILYEKKLFEFFNNNL